MIQPFFLFLPLCMAPCRCECEAEPSGVPVSCGWGSVVSRLLEPLMCVGALLWWTSTCAECEEASEFTFGLREREMRGALCLTC